jgi:hypothetical protein
VDRGQYDIASVQGSGCIEDSEPDQQGARRPPWPWPVYSIVRREKEDAGEFDMNYLEEMAP